VIAIAAAEPGAAEEVVREHVLPPVLAAMVGGGNGDGGGGVDGGAAAAAAAAIRAFPLPPPGGNGTVRIRPSSGSSGAGTRTGTRTEVIVLPGTFLPPCVGEGYTVVVTGGDGGGGDGGGDGGGGDDDDEDEDAGAAFASALGTEIWEALTGGEGGGGGGDWDATRPIDVGSLEWESLRIEGGWPARGTEMTGDEEREEGEGTWAARAGPLELGLDSTIDEAKGCYLGQEAVSAALRNPRGPARTLYAVEFRNGGDAYEGNDDADDGGDVTELAELLGAVRAAPGRGQDGDGRAAVLPPPAAGPPSAGTVLHVLGSAGTIRAGRITSIAEPDGTGSPVTAGLALIGRAGPILRRMGDLDLDLELEESPGARGAPGGRLDPLDGLRVLVGSTGTVGTLRTLPCRRFGEGANMFEAWDDEPDAAVAAAAGGGSVMGFVDVDAVPAEELVPVGWDAEAEAEAEATDGSGLAAGGDNFEAEEELRRAEVEAAAAAAEVEAAAAEAKRKAEKMEMLKKKAEEAMKRRRKKRKNNK
jgi:hypothetical protein